MSQPRIGICTQGGKGIGLGHIRRCLTLAATLENQGALVGFVVNDDPVAQELVQAQGHSVVGRTDALDRVMNALQDWHARAVVADSYALTSANLTALRAAVGYLVVVDDLANQALPADIVMNSSLRAPALQYQALPHTEFLLGPAYVLLRSEFAARSPREIRDQVERVLITVGGSDPFGLTPRLVDWVLASLDDISMDVVVGPFFENTSASVETGQTIVHREPRDMRALMLSADIAVTGGGQTTYELAAAGTPAIAISLAENQRSNLTGLAEAGTLDYMGNVGDGDLGERVVTALKGLAANRERRRAMSERGQQLVDGRGAERVAQAILERI